MPRCDVCGNEYANTMEIRQGDRAGTFDSFECAIHAMAPTCSHCGCRVIGHGVEIPGGGPERVFCCAACARKEGVQEVRA